ncbi:hypothetical protein AN214_04264 [Pseudoalteromonas sp. P1-9]|nr:hypothetical protein AN214_04264 [Pseudoalteromonas sp. P1-9]
MDCWLHSTPDLKHLFSTDGSQHLNVQFFLSALSKRQRLLGAAFYLCSQVA